MIDPTLASNLTYIIQGLIVLFIGADVLILSVWNSRKKLRPARRTAGDARGGGRGMSTWAAPARQPDQRTAAGRCR